MARWGDRALYYGEKGRARERPLYENVRGREGDIEDGRKGVSERVREIPLYDKLGGSEVGD